MDMPQVLDLPQDFEIIGYVAAGLTLLAATLRTLIPIRLAMIGANICFIAFSALGGIWPTLVLHAALLPVNLYRLTELLRLSRDVRRASQGDLNLAWLKPFMHARTMRAGDRVFSRGEPAEALYFVVTGRFRLEEIDASVGPGEMIGELGLVTSDNRRTLSFVCEAEGRLLVITYDEVRALFLQNPLFGFYLLKLVGRRLMNDLARLGAAPHPETPAVAPTPIARMKEAVE